MLGVMLNCAGIANKEMELAKKLKMHCDEMQDKEIVTILYQLGLKTEDEMGPADTVKENSEGKCDDDYGKYSVCVNSVN